MIETIRPYGAVKEHEKDYLLDKGNRWYIVSYYGGICEISKEKFTELKERNWEIRWKKIDKNNN